MTTTRKDPYFGSNQRILMEAAFSGMNRIEFHLRSDSGGAHFGAYARLSDLERDAIKKVFNEYRGEFMMKVLVFVPSAQSERCFVVGENSQYEWVPLNADAAWPPNEYIVERLKALVKPYQWPSNYFSNRNLGFLSLFTSGIAFFNAWAIGWYWQHIALALLISGSWHLCSYYLAAPWKHVRRRHAVLRAMAEEGITFVRTQPKEAQVILGRSPLRSVPPGSQT